MKKNILKNRLGVIEVSKLILEDFEKDYNLPKVFFSKFFPINIKDDFQTIHYFGYCEDSRKAEKIYKSVRKELLNMQKLFSDEELEILALIQ